METNLFMLRCPSFSVILSVWEGSPMVSLPASVHGILRRFTPQDDRPVSQPSPPLPCPFPGGVLGYLLFHLPTASNKGRRGRRPLQGAARYRAKAPLQGELSAEPTEGSPPQICLPTVSHTGDRKGRPYAVIAGYLLFPSSDHVQHGPSGTPAPTTR